MDVLKQLLEEARRVLRDMTSTQRAAVVTMIMTVGLLLFFMVFLGSIGDSKSEVPLPMTVGEGDAKEMMDNLDAQGIKSRYDINQKKIYVSVKDSKKAVMYLAEENMIPENAASGFEEMLAKMSVFDTVQMNSEKLKNALQNEIGWMIESLDAVKTARVVYSSPTERRLFSPPSRERATISVEMALGKKLNQNLADTIIRLVAYARTGLDPKDVVVSDQYANRFQLSDDDSVGQRALRKAQLNKQTSEATRRKIEELVRARFRSTIVESYVFVDTEHDLTETTVEKNEVLEGFAASTIKRKVTDSSTSKPANIPGVQPNVQRTTFTSASSAGTETKRDYAQNETNTRMQLGSLKTRTRPDSVIRKQTISVVIHLPFEWKKDADGNFETAKDADGAEVLDPITKKPMRIKIPAPELQKPELDELESAIAKAAGQINGEEGREIEIVQVPWVEPLLPPVQTDGAATQVITWLQGNVMPILLLLSIVAAVYFLYMQAKRALPAEQYQMKNDEVESLSATPMSDEEKANAEFEHLRGQVGEFVSEDPTKAANIVRRWMTTRDGY